MTISRPVAVSEAENDRGQPYCDRCGSRRYVCRPTDRKGGPARRAARRTKTGPAPEIARDLEAATQAQRNAAARLLRRRLQGELISRHFIDRAYPPFQDALSSADETMVCRYEEVTVGEIRRFVRLGCQGPNRAGAFGRHGMGSCQEQYCGLTVTELRAAESGQSPDVTGYDRIRPPIKSVTLGELANMPATEWQPNGRQANDREI